MSTAHRLKKKRTLSGKPSPLEETLLNEGERAALKAIRATVDGEIAEKSTCIKCLKRSKGVFCNGGSISIIFMLTVLIIGATLFGLSFSHKVFQIETKKTVRLVSSFVLYGGVFGSLGGLSNLLILIMLFYKVPLLYGSGVLKRKHCEISDILRKIVLQMLFDSEHLERYFIERINQFSVQTNIVECITGAMESRKAEKIIEDHLTKLYDSPDAYYLQILGVTRDRLKPMIGPAVLSLCAEAAPVVFGEFRSRDSVAVSVPDIRKAMDQYLRRRMRDLPSESIAQFMKDILFHHLSGLIVFGSVTGCVIGIVAQGLRFTTSPSLNNL